MRAVKDPGWDGLMVYANRGRWIAECECRSADQVQPTLRRWQCSECGARWTLLWPGSREQIERLLMMRPAVNRNWLPEETIEMLVAENIEHGLIEEPA